MLSDVIITEVSLRDGLQIEPVIVSTSEKLVLAASLIEAGFAELEVGAFVNPAKVPTMADSGQVLQGLTNCPARLHTLVFNLRGAERAAQSGAENVRLIVSASDGHSVANAGVPTEAALTRIEEAARWLAPRGIGMEATIATAFVCPFDGDTPVRRVVSIAQRLADMGIQVLHLADTIGAATPGDIRRVLHAIRTDLPQMPLGLHLHDTYGMAIANAWEGLRWEVRRFDAAVGGLGGCPFAPGAAGNIAADDLINMLHREGLTTGVDSAEVLRIRELLEKIVGHPLDSAMARLDAAPSLIRSDFLQS